MTAFDRLTFLLLLLPVYYGSAFAHELGYALMGKLSGFAVTSFGLGFARPWLVFSVRGTRIFFCRSKPLGGVTFAYWPEIFPPKAANTVLFAGGILANSLLAVLGLALGRRLAWGHTLWITLAGLNGYLALLSLVPYRVRVGKVTLRPFIPQSAGTFRDCAPVGAGCS